MLCKGDRGNPRRQVMEQRNLGPEKSKSLYLDWRGNGELKEYWETVR
jgi:hypothetical protein